MQVAQQQAAYAIPGMDDTEDAQVAIAAKKRKLLEAVSAYFFSRFINRL